MTRFVLRLTLAATLLLVTLHERGRWPSRRCQPLGRALRTDHAVARPILLRAVGAPVSLVVPPTANMQTSMGWGVAQTEMMPIYHQFSRPYPGDGEGLGVGFLSTPRWPSHTDQFGVYYVRGPWR